MKYTAKKYKPRFPRLPLRFQPVRNLRDCGVSRHRPRRKAVFNV